MRPNIVGPRHNLPILRPSLSQTPNCAEPARIFPLPQARPSTRPSTCSLKHVRKRKSDATCTSMGRDAGISHFRASQYQGHCNQTYQEDCSRRNLPSLLPPVTICLRRVGYTTRTSDVPVACRTATFRWLLVCVIWWRGHGLSRMRLAARRRRPWNIRGLYAGDGKYELERHAFWPSLQNGAGFHFLKYSHWVNSFPSHKSDTVCLGTGCLI